LLGYARAPSTDRLLDNAAFICYAVPALDGHLAPATLRVHALRIALVAWMLFLPRCLTARAALADVPCIDGALTLVSLPLLAELWIYPLLGFRVILWFSLAARLSFPAGLPACLRLFRDMLPPAQRRAFPLSNTSRCYRCLSRISIFCGCVPYARGRSAHQRHRRAWTLAWRILSGCLLFAAFRCQTTCLPGAGHQDMDCSRPQRCVA
jgi:hypothetical protein